jgi:antitoxin HicB
MALASRNATVPIPWRWALGSAQQPTGAHRAGSVLHPQRQHRGATWVHQENAEDTTGGPGFSEKANEGTNTLMSKRRNPHIGSSLDDLLKEEGIFEEVQVQAIKEVIAWQLEEAMKKKQVSKARLAKLLRTSRTQVNRLLDPQSDVTLSSLQRAAALVGRRVRLDLV